MQRVSTRRLDCLGIPQARHRLGHEGCRGSMSGADRRTQSVNESLGFRAQPEFWSVVVGSWLDNDANR